MRQGHLGQPAITMRGLADAGRYAELSATHLCSATAELLDRWAGSMAHEAPLIVASNIRGWFISTQVIRPQACDLPEELARALTLGRRQGLGFLFFHCDAPVLTGLPVHDW